MSYDKLLAEYAKLDAMIETALAACRGGRTGDAVLRASAVVAETKRLDRMLDREFGPEEVI